MNIYNYWEDVLSQNADKIKTYFKKDAYIRWHNTNEHFTVDEFIIANCEYPGDWAGDIERIEHIDNLIITVTNVYTVDKKLSFYVTSFIKIEDEKIISIDEYWGDNGNPPNWRIERNIGSKIKGEN